jgi:hypothetical protein
MLNMGEEALVGGAGVFRNCLNLIDELYYAHGRADFASF